QAELAAVGDVFLAGLWESAPRTEGVEIPFQVLGQPSPDAKPRLTLGSPVPRCGKLDNTASPEKRLHRELQIQFEAGGALDGHVSQNAAVVEFERIRG